jgi:uncharacterized protein YbjT (DUF2867 family)
MRIVVIGGTGLIGSRVVGRLTDQGHQAVPAAPSTGVDTVTGEGLAAALAGADVVVDVSNSPSFDAEEARAFFETATANVLAAEADAGVGHHVVLSVVGVDRSPGIGYFRAKVVQEQLVAAGPVPYTIVRATQFFEFLGGIADGATVDGTVRLGPVAIQPMAADDVAAAVAGAAVGAPVKGVVEVGGPERYRLDELIRSVLADRGDPREVVTDPAAGYFGAVLTEGELVPGDGATLAPTHLADWSAR